MALELEGDKVMASGLFQYAAEEKSVDFGCTIFYLGGAALCRNLTTF
jgi:hypothetical protein